MSAFKTATPILLSASACLATALAGCGGDDDDGCDLEAVGTICTIAGTGERGFSRTTGPAAKAALNTPIDVAVSPDGELWIVDMANLVVRAIDADGDLRTVVGSGDHGSSPPDGVERVPAREALLNFNGGLAFHGDHLYLAAWLNSQVKRVRLSDMTLENFAGRGVRERFDGDGGPARAAALDLPSAIAIDPSGNVAIMDQGNQVIRRVDGDGAIRTIAGQCITELDAPCAQGQAPAPCPDSNKRTCGDPAETCDYSTCAPSFSGDGGPALQARIGLSYGATAMPSGHMVYDPAGNLLFADTDNHRIRKIDTAGVITTIAGNGERGFAGDDGPATLAQLDSPVGLALAPDGTLFFTDVFNDCVRKIDPSGTISRVAGQCGLDRGFAGDGGPALDAKLDRPHGLTLDGNKLYFADAGNHRVRVVRLAR